MVEYKKVHGAVEPPEVKITANAVYVATNIEPYEITVEDHTISGYQYDYTIYSNEEYINKITEDNSQKITALEEELQATKILLGVE